MNATIRAEYQSSSTSVIVTGSAFRDRIDQLEADPDKPIYHASDFSEAIVQAEAIAPSVLLTEDRMLTGIDLNSLRIRLALGRSVRILVYMEEQDDTRRCELLLAGVAGFFDRNSSTESMRQAIIEVAKGHLWASPEVLSDTIRTMVSAISDPRFTKREMEILRRIAAGQDNRTIADNLFITRETVRWHLRSAYSKLGVHDRRSVVEMMRSA
jgi:DNA-binding NarL/FixJ family response regulator